jgi:CheY-like chemotaxis protein
MLKELGYQVLTAANGREALKLYEENQDDITLVLTDMTMPEMGGEELTAALHKLDPQIKVVVLTGYPLNSEAKEVLTQGVVDWLQKPISLKVLAQTLNQHLHLEADRC